MSHISIQSANRLIIPIIFLIWILGFPSPGWSLLPSGADLPELKKLLSQITWLAHDSFRINADGLILYIDPFNLATQEPKADLILITDDHQDHCSPADVAKIQKTDTVIVTVPQAATKLTGQIKRVKPWEELIIKGITIQTVPAFNTNKFRSPGVLFHPKDSNYVGFIIKVERKRIYHAGDSDFVPEMKGLEVDIALLPVSGLYVMTAEEAAEAAMAIKPKLAIPMHVGGPVGSLSDAQRFKEKVGIPVTILPIEK